MKNVSAKKHLGQHFLTDESIAKKIGESLVHSDRYNNILEVGPGMGVMTKYILKKYSSHDFKLIELDKESVDYLSVQFPLLQVYNEDFLKLDFKKVFKGAFAVIGNYPYNISSQIFVKILKYKRWPPKFTDLIFMFQKELGDKIIGKFQSSNYGRLSILSDLRLKVFKKFNIRRFVV